MGKLITGFIRLKPLLYYHLTLFLNYTLWATYLSDQSLTLFLITKLISAFLFIAASTYLVNDFYDLKADLLAQKLNLSKSLNPIVSWILILGFWTIGFLISYSISIPLGLFTLFHFCSALLYSHPSTRLKESTFGGIALDSFYAHLFPLIYLALAFKLGFDNLFVIGLLGFALTLGTSDIIKHQQSDLQNDLKAGVSSFVIKHPKWVNPILMICELLGLACLILLIILSIDEITFIYKLVLGIGSLFIILYFLTKPKNFIKHSIRLRAYIIWSVLFLGVWLIEEKNYWFFILLIHPYIFQFLEKLKSYIALLVNYALYYIFKLFGRDLKEKPLS